MRLYTGNLPLLTIVLILAIECKGSAEHKKLLNDMQKNFNLLERPVRFENETVEVKFGLTVMKLLEFNVAQGYLELYMWLTIEWTDDRLIWSSKKYGGITHFSIPTWKVWKPDIHLYNSNHEYFDRKFETNVVVKNDGTLIYVPPGISRSTCLTNAAHYPFDEHNCSLKFGSWTFSGDRINISLKDENGEVDFTSYAENYEWQILGGKGVANKIIYACCPEPYVDVTFVVNLKRRGDEIFAGISFTLILASSGILIGFVVPSNQLRLRINLGIITLVALMHKDIAGINHDLSGHKPIIASYFRTLCFLVLVSIGTNIGIFHIYTRNSTLYKIPERVRTLFCERLTNFIFIRSPKTYQRLKSTRDRGDSIVSATGHEILVSDLEDLVGRGDGTAVPKHLNDWQTLAVILDRLALIFFAALLGIYFLVYFNQFS